VRSLSHRFRGAGRTLRRGLAGWRRDSSGPAILMYHRIAVAEEDPWGMAVSPACFEEQLDWLSSRRRILPLAEFDQRRRAGLLPPNAVALTFDDGYACNAEVAGPLLAQFEAPATVFLATGAVSSGEEFWWDRLQHIVSAAPAPALVLEVEDQAFTVELGEPPGLALGGAREQAYFELWGGLRRLGEGDRRAVLDALATRAGVGTTPRSTHLPMSEAQARALAGSGLVSLGAHSVTHPPLSELSPNDRRREIEASLAACADLAGAPVQVFAYPFGDYDVATLEAVRAAGVTTAVTTDEALVVAGCSSLALPRLQVGPWSADELADALGR
jgi:peptidoglycan/xylan/chitin deacetylase (PgdA/CDA1 family)